MPGAMSDYLEAKILDHILGTAAYTMPTPYLALFTSDPTDAGTGTEVSGGAYARQTIAFDPAVSPGGSAINSADVLFPVATAAWGTITHLALYDAPTGGNLLYHTAANQSKVIDVNDQYKLGAGNLTVTQD